MSRSLTVQYGPQGKPSDAAKIKNEASQAHIMHHGNP